MGFYFISHGASDWAKAPPPQMVDGKPVEDTPSFADLSNHSKQTFIVVALMTVLSFVSAFVFILLLKRFPRCMVYTSIVVSALFLIFIGFIAFAAGHFGLGAAMVGILLVYTILLCCCFRQNIEATIIMLRLTA